MLFSADCFSIDLGIFLCVFVRHANGRQWMAKQVLNLHGMPRCSLTYVMKRLCMAIVAAQSDILSSTKNHNDSQYDEPLNANSFRAHALVSYAEFHLLCLHAHEHSGALATSGPIVSHCCSSLLEVARR